jgi:hypothetical protein
MSHVKSTKKGSRKGKAEGSKGEKADAQLAADELTGDRIRSILSDPATPERVKSKLRDTVGQLGEWTNPPIELTPDFMSRTFLAAAEGTRAGRIVPREEAAEAVLTNLTLYVERHEPKAFKVARRCVEIYNEWKGRKKGRKYADGAYYFSEHVDALMESGGQQTLLDFNSEYFIPFFVEAARDCGPKDYRYHRLLDLIRRVDEGADLNQLRDEENRQRAERSARYEVEELAKPEPKDKTSDEWRYWKLRQMKNALRGEDKAAASAAVEEFIGYAEGFLGQRRFVVSEVEELLPDLIIFWQRRRGGKKRGRK